MVHLFYMLSHKRLSSLVIAASLFIIIAMPSVVRADVNDFTITDFSADYYLNQNDSQGGLDISENISVDFTDQNHGILRALPERYDGHALNVSIKKVLRDGAEEDYSTYSENDNKVLKIGDGDRTITGKHTYKIDYSVVNVMRFPGGHDELTWNVNGTGWGQPVSTAVARLHVPKTLVQKLGNTECYTGSYGGTDKACSVRTKAAIAFIRPQLHCSQEQP